MASDSYAQSVKIVNFDAPGSIFCVFCRFPDGFFEGIWVNIGYHSVPFGVTFAHQGRHQKREKTLQDPTASSWQFDVKKGRP